MMTSRIAVACRHSLPRSLSRRTAVLSVSPGSELVKSPVHLSDSNPNRFYNSCRNRQFFSTTTSSVTEDGIDQDGPEGDLFQSEVNMDMMGKTATIRRTFHARSNAQGLLTCGGEALAKHSSFDPSYERAQTWIRHHAVGPAVLSPILISGLVGALVEAAMPNSVPVSSQMNQIRPLIVGVEVVAKIEVVSLSDSDETSTSDCGSQSSREDLYERKNGYAVGLKTEVARVRDGAVIADGCTSVWIPDYQNM